MDKRNKIFEQKLKGGKRLKENVFLTTEEKEDIRQCLKESDAGETYSLEKVKKELCQK